MYSNSSSYPSGFGGLPGQGYPLAPCHQEHTWLCSLELSGHVKVPNKTGVVFQNNTPPTKACATLSCQKLSNSHQLRQPFNCRNEGGKLWIINELDLVFEVILGL